MNLSPDPQLATSSPMDYEEKYDALLLKETKTNNDNIYLKSRFEELKETHKLLINQLVEHKIIKAEEWFETGDISSSLTMIAGVGLNKIQYLKKENEKLKKENKRLEEGNKSLQKQMKELREDTETYIRETYGLEGFRCPQRGTDGWGSLPTPQTNDENDLKKEIEKLKEEVKKWMDERLEFGSQTMGWKDKIDTILYGDKDGCDGDWDKRIDDIKKLKEEVKRLEEEKQQSLTILQEANSDILGDIKQGLTKDKLKKENEELKKENAHLKTHDENGERLTASRFDFATTEQLQQLNAAFPYKD